MNRQLIDFYRNEAPDTQGRMLREMWQWNDFVLEAEHDYIQWMFPTVTPSNYNTDAPILDPETVKVWREDIVLQENLQTSFERFLLFLGLRYFAPYNEELKNIDPNNKTVMVAEDFHDIKIPAIWSHFNHNFLRITRVLESLRILGKSKEADSLLEWLEQFRWSPIGEQCNISDNTMEYWRKTKEWNKYLPDNFLVPKKRTLVIFSGAGLSQESGVPTFRDNNGLWENHKVEDVASQDGWRRNQKMVLEFYAKRFEGVKAVKPNAAHESIAKLEEKFKVINITQNIDDLLERAGANHVWHLHGQITRKKCEWHSEISNLDGDTQFVCDYKTEATSPVIHGDNCIKCGSQMRPDVVWFGEAVDLTYDKIAQYLKEVKYDDGAFMCIGTSAQVYPAAFLLPFFSQVKNKYIINKEPLRIADYDMRTGPATVEMIKLAEELLRPSF